MPLTRYKIRNEYSLANADLYRGVAKDDPEGLLEGVAMAGLVGIVRQLGDLAEFAAEVFHDLHEEVLATAARGHELLNRVQQLEAELPLVEKMMVVQSNYVNFAYNPGVEWHANVRNDQNHFMQGDLPRFIRNAYEDCRGPPRLFLLDKFDVAGAGACLKRYTDPSFFRMEWASSELMKAEKEQQDKKSRRVKRKGRRQRNGEIRDSFLAPHLQPSFGRNLHVPSDVENTASTSVRTHILNSRHGSEQECLGSKLQECECQPQSLTEQRGLSSKPSKNVIFPDSNRKELSFKSEEAVQDIKENGEVIEPSDSKLSMADSKLSMAKFDFEKGEIEGIANKDGLKEQRTQSPSVMKMPADVTEDFVSETDNYMDALTTMESEIETDAEVKTIDDWNGDLGQNDREREAMAQSKQAAFNCQRKSSRECGFVTEDGVLSSQDTPKESEISERVEPAYVAGSPEAEYTDEQTKPTFVDDRCVSPSTEQSRASISFTESSISTPPLLKSALKSQESVESESAEGVPETPETPDTNEWESLGLKNLASVFQQLPEPAVPLGNGHQTGFPEPLGSLSAHLGVKSSVLLTNKKLSPIHVDKPSFEDSESEASASIKELFPESGKDSSPHSSADSSIQPMNWPIDLLRRPSNVLNSDDELEGMHVSSSSSSSVLSSPRPSTLATTVFNMEYGNKFTSLLSAEGSIKSSPESLIGVSPHSIGSTTCSPLFGANRSVMSPHLLQTPSCKQLAGLGFEPNLSREKVVTAQNQRPGADEPESFPPPPPLPPLEWRTTRQFGAFLSPSIKASESSALLSTCESSIPQDSSQAFETFNLRSFGLQSNSAGPNQLVHASKPSTWDGHSHGLSLPMDELQELPYDPASSPQNLPVVDLPSTQDHESPSTKLPTPFNFTGRVDYLKQPFRTQVELPFLHEVSRKTSEAVSTGHPTIQSSPERLNESLQPYRYSTTESVDNNQQESTRIVAQIEEHDAEGYSAPLEPSSNPCAAETEEISTDDDHQAKVSSPPRSEESTNVFPPRRSSRVGSLDGLPRPVGSKIERSDSLIAAIASHDKSTLKKVPHWSQSLRTTQPNDRDNLLEQIRTGSFSLRHTKVEKQEAPRPVANINVAAILEKANAIRQAFAGSDDDDDDDDDWSDS